MREMKFSGARLVAIFLAFTIVGVTYAFDPDIMTDFVVPVGDNSAHLDGSFFTFMGFRAVGNNNLAGQTAAKVTKAAMAEFPALTGLDVSMAVLQFPAGAVNPPHIHPRASELLLLVNGSLLVGFIDTIGKLFTQTLRRGDLFVFPKGLLYFQKNTCKFESTAIAGFGSANAGTVSLPSALFASGIPDDVLAKSFKIDVKTIEILKAANNPTPR